MKFATKHVKFLTVATIEHQEARLTKTLQWALKLTQKIPNLIRNPLISKSSKSNKISSCFNLVSFTFLPLVEQHVILNKMCTKLCPCFLCDPGQELCV